QAARALGGDAYGRNRALVPGPGHSRHDRSLSVTFLSTGILVHSFAGDDWKTCRQHVNDRLGLSQFKPRLLHVNKTTPVSAEPDRDQAARLERARRLWTESVPLHGTLGHTYLTKHRGLDIDRPQLGHALRWHDGERCIVARVVDPSLPNAATGVHRIYLNK